MATHAAWTLADEQFGVCGVMEIPMLGMVAAGEPYQAFPVQETLDVPTSLWAGKQVFALRVRGSSMIDEGIHNGDYLIVEPRQQADNGQTVVAEVDGCVTVKKYYREADGHIRLQPANPEMLPLRVHGDHVRIIGTVAGVVRKFGFHSGRPLAGRPSSPAPRATTGSAAAANAPHAAAPQRAYRDDASLDLAVNVMDAQLIRWTAALTQARKEKRLRQHLAQMEEMGRDLQTLRDWCARTTKRGLRRALVTEANALMHRMQRFATLTPVQLPDLVLH